MLPTFRQGGCQQCDVGGFAEADYVRENQSTRRLRKSYRQLPKLRPKVDESNQNWSVLGQQFSDARQLWPKLANSGKGWPMLVIFVGVWTNIDRHRAIFDRCQPNLGQTWANQAKSSADLVQHSVDFGQPLTNTGQIGQTSPNLANVAQDCRHWSIFAKFGRMLATCGQRLPNAVNFGHCLTGLGELIVKLGRSRPDLSFSSCSTTLAQLLGNF